MRFDRPVDRRRNGLSRRGFVGGAALSAAASGVALSAHPGFAQTPGGQLYEAAKKEGEFFVYTTVPASYIEKLAVVFNAKFPGVRMRTFSATAAPLQERYLADIGRGAVQADVLQSSDAFITKIVAQGVVAEYTPAGAAAMPEALRGFAPFAWPIHLDEHVIAYNPDLVSPADAKLLESWDGAVDPRWKGKLAIADPNLVGGWYNGFYMLWKIKGPEWFAKLAALQPTIYNSNIPAVEAVVAGQHSFAMTIDPYPSDYFSKGAPIVTLWPSPTPVWAAYSLISKNAPHPNAARLFTEWLISPEGMGSWAEIYQVTVPLPGIADKRAFAKAPWFTGAKEKYVLNPRDLEREGKQALAAWNKAFGRT